MRAVLSLGGLLALDLACSSGAATAIPPIEWIEVSYADIGFEFEHLSSSTVYDSGEFLSVTQNDRIAEVSFGQFPRLNQVTNHDGTESLPTVTASPTATTSPTPSQSPTPTQEAEPPESPTTSSSGPQK